MIRGYAEQPSPRAAGTLTLRVATDAPQFRVEFYRYGTAMDPTMRSAWLPGRDAPLHLPFHDWGTAGTNLHGESLTPWPAYRFPLPCDWRPGIYIAVLVEGDGTGRDRCDPDRTTPDAREGRALFVVRAARGTAPAPILYKLPLLTYHAYNLIDGREYDPADRRGNWCLYDTDRLAGLPDPVPPGVGLHRPGGGTGAVPYDIATNPDPFDPTPRQTLVHWDAKFIAWMEAAGYRADYCTDVDLHREGNDLLRPYRLLVSVGHDEYWSDAMRDAVEDFVAAGGNAAFFSGNTAWWRVVFHDELTFSRVGFWHEAGRPENTMIGVSFRNGGERDRADFPVPVGYRVQHADHWVYAGTGLRDGDVFGGGPHEYLIGYECDGAEFDRSDLQPGRTVTPGGTDGTPDGFLILAVGDTRPSGTWGFGNGAATMGLFRRGGTVFTASTTDWARVLTAGTTPAVQRITRNVLDRLGR
ncbi:MAG TPA: N,N-dimethylformamidase beta subunit family domain-containing protein [Actinoplanes sp.]|nr:N,N-dimethylformamidase beta subunit family domain-containing protein [Actinoplanes sp.]